MLEVLDRAYQAAVDPSLWPKALSGICDAFGGHQTVVMRSDTRRVAPSTQMNTLSDPLALPAYMNGGDAINPIQAAINEGLAAGFLPPVSTDQTYIRRADFERSDYYNGFFRRFDMHSVIMVSMPESRITLNVLRAPGQPLFDAREIELGLALRPVLSRAFELGERMRAVRAVNEGLAAFAERSPGAVILAGGDGRIVHVNRAAEVLLAQSDGLRVRNGVLQAEVAQDRRLAALVGAAAAASGAGPHGGAMTLPRPSGRRALSVLVAPAHSESGGEGPRLALISVLDPEQAPPLPLDRLRELFGLTPGEARVVAELVAGHGPRAIGARLGVSHHTVRAQLARAMAKTETSRQSDLVALVVRALVGGVIG